MLPALPEPGNTPTKAASRDWVYRRALQLFQAGGRPNGWAVVLAGRGAEEVYPLRFLLEWEPTKVLFVDRDPKGLKKMKSLWPRAYRYYGELADALPELKDGVGFANFDFMGLFTPTVRECFRLLGEILLARGFVSYTFSRGRENQNASKYWKPAIKAAGKYLRDHPDLEFSTDPDLLRFLGYGVLVEESLGLSDIHLASTIRYRSKRIGGTAMGVISMQYMPEALHTNEWLDALSSDRFGGTISYEMVDKNAV